MSIDNERRLPENLVSREILEEGVDFWRQAMLDAGVDSKLLHYNDVLTGKQAPGGYDHGPSLEDVVIADKLCDVYHTDGHLGDKKRTIPGARVFIHVKGDASK